MRSSRGFTLIETLLATGILVTALLSIAVLFSYSIRTNLLNQQRTTATLLAMSKIEDLRSTSSINDFTNGGGLDGSNPAPSYWEYVSISTMGLFTIDTSTNTAPYLRLWQIDGTNPKLITVVVFAQRSGITGERIELARSTTGLTNGY